MRYLPLVASALWRKPVRTILTGLSVTVAYLLFGVLQVVIFGWTVREGQAIPRMRWIGALIAFLGLIILLWPTGRASVPFAEALAMVAAAAGWAVYTLLGRTETDALGATAGNFLLCVPLTGLASVAGLAGLPMVPDGDSALSGPSVLAAATAGAVTSGLGYALWYRILPALPTTVAAGAERAPEDFPSLPPEPKVVTPDAGGSVPSVPYALLVLLTGTAITIVSATLAIATRRRSAVLRSV